MSFTLLTLEKIKLLKTGFSLPKIMFSTKKQMKIFGQVSLMFMEDKRVCLQVVLSQEFAVCHIILVYRTFSFLKMVLSNILSLIS